MLSFFLKSGTILLLLHLTQVYCQNQFVGIASSKTNSHFIGYEFHAKAKERVQLSLILQDSSIHVILLDSTFNAHKRIILTFKTEKKDILQRYPGSLILLYPEMKEGIYFIQFTNNDTTIVRKFLFMK